MSLMGTPDLRPDAESGVWQFVASQVLVAAAATISFTGLSGAAFFRLDCTVLLVGEAGSALKINNASGYDRQSLYSEATNITGSRVTGSASLAADGSSDAGATQYTVMIIGKAVAGGEGYAIYGLSIDTGAILMWYSESSVWENTTDLITRIDVNQSGAADFDVGSTAAVFQKEAA